MGFNTACVHRLRSFEEAKAWFEKTKPIRGNKDNVRPYGSRRHWHMASIAMPDDDTVVLNYYNKPLTTWKSDGTFTIQAPVYYSAYAVDHLHWYLPMDRGEFKWNKGRMFIKLPDGKQYALSRSTGSLAFQKEGDKYFMLTKPRAYNVRKNRKAYTNALKAYAPFVDWAGTVLSINDKAVSGDLVEAMGKLITDSGLPTRKSLYDLVYSDMANLAFKPELRIQLHSSLYGLDRLPFRGRSAYGAYTNFNRPTCETLNAWITGDDQDMWPHALYAIGERQHLVYSWQGSDVTVTLRHDLINKFVETLCCFMNRDSVFNKVLLEDGEVSSKQNYQYFEEELSIVDQGFVDNVSKILSAY